MDLIEEPLFRLVPFGWHRFAGIVSKPLHRHVVERWVNLHLSAAGRTEEWQQGRGRPLKKQGNLQRKAIFNHGD